MSYKILERDPSLKPYESEFKLRMERYEKKKKELLPRGGKLIDFANGAAFFGFHKAKDGWYYREWAPAAEKLYLTGDFCNWDRHAFEAKKLENGVFELFIPGRDTLKDGMRVSAVVVHNGAELDRIPLYARRVVQDKKTFGWDAVIYDPEEEFVWTDSKFVPKKNLLVYECHIGMAQEEGKVGSYDEFRVTTPSRSWPLWSTPTTPPLATRCPISLPHPPGSAAPRL